MADQPFVTSNVLVVSFEHDDNAYEALTELKELDSQGQIDLQGAGVVVRHEDGRTGSNDAGAGSPGAALMQSSPRDSRCRRVDKVCSAPRRRPPSRKREPSHLSST